MLRNWLRLGMDGVGVCCRAGFIRPVAPGSGEGRYKVRGASSTCAVVATALEPGVQEGDGSGATGSPHMADMHKAPGLVPWVGK